MTDKAGIDLITEGITTAECLSSNSLAESAGIDLITEGITTKGLGVLNCTMVSAGIDLITEGITTSSRIRPLGALLRLELT